MRHGFHLLPQVVPRPFRSHFENGDGQPAAAAVLFQTAFACSMSATKPSVLFLYRVRAEALSVNKARVLKGWPSPTLLGRKE